MSQIIGVLLPLPFNDVFDYKTEENVPLGSFVRVPFGRERQIGVVWKIGRSSKLEENKIKAGIRSFKFSAVVRSVAQIRDFRRFV